MRNIRRIRAIAFYSFLIVGFPWLSTASGHPELGFPKKHKLQQEEQNPGQDKDIERVAQRMYKSAIASLEEKDFWQSTHELIILLDYYPSFSKVDGVICYLGDCLYEMEMYRSSDKMYRYLMANYPESSFIPQALLGLQKIYFNTQELDESLKYYVGITTRYPDDNIIDGANYYGGMTYYYQKNYDEAIQSLSKIRSRSEYFDYGIYTVGLSFLKKKIFNNPSKRFES